MRERERRRKRDHIFFGGKLIKTIIKICGIEIIRYSGVNLGSFHRRTVEPPPPLSSYCYDVVVKGVYDNYDKMDVKLNRKQKHTQTEMPWWKMKTT